MNEAWQVSLPGLADARLPGGTDCYELHQLVRERGGVDRGWSNVQATFTSHSAVELTVEQVRSRVEKRHPASDDPILTCIQDEESFLSAPEMMSWPNDEGSVWVDDDGFVATPWQEGGNRQGADNVRLAPGDTFQIFLTAYAVRCDCEWRLEISMTVNGNPYRQLIGDGDQPFRTAPASAKLDKNRDQVWCAVTRNTRRGPPSRQFCPAPTRLDEPIYY